MRWRTPVLARETLRIGYSDNSEKHGDIER